MGGVAVMHALGSARGGVRLLAMSGYAADDVLNEPMCSDFDAFLAKPFRLAELAEAVVAALGGSGAVTG